MGFTVDILPSHPRKPDWILGYDTRGAMAGLGMGDAVCAIVGQKLTSGTADVKSVYDLMSSDDAAVLFGVGSWMHRMVRDVFAVNPYGTYRAVCGDDDGAKASVVVTLSGAAIVPGYFYLTLAGEMAAVAFATGDTAATVATNMNAVLTKDQFSAWPVTASVSGSGVVLTAKNGGIEGNTIVASVSFSASGTGITAVVGSSGSRGYLTDGVDGPFDVDNLLDALLPQHNAIIAFPYLSDSRLGKLKAYLNVVSGPVERRPGVGIAAMVNTGVSKGKDHAASVNARRIGVAFLKDTDTPVPQIAASVAAAVLSQPDPALPFDGYVLSTIVAPPGARELTRTEQEYLLANGVTPLETVRGGGVSIVRLVSTETDGPSASLPDMWIRTMDFVREAAVNRVKADFTGAKLITRMPGSVWASLIGTMKQLETREIVKNVDQWKDRLTVVPDIENPGWLKVRIPCDGVVGLHGMTGFIDLIV